MKKVVLSITLLVLSSSVGLGNPIVVPIQRESYVVSHASPDVRSILCALVIVILIETVVLAFALRSKRVLWICPLANVLSTLPGVVLPIAVPVTVSPFLPLLLLVATGFLISVFFEAFVNRIALPSVKVSRLIGTVFTANLVSYCCLIAVVVISPELVLTTDNATIIEIIKDKPQNPSAPASVTIDSR